MRYIDTHTGQQVTVTKRSTWDGWVDAMDAYIGNVLTIKYTIYDSYDKCYRCIMENEPYIFPLDVLEPIITVPVGAPVEDVTEQPETEDEKRYRLKQEMRRAIGQIR